MKKPDTSPLVTDPDLCGGSDHPSWVQGRNCVYSGGILAEYRVAIRTPEGWKSYGHFNDLETATYVANIAILAEGCEDSYELNVIYGEKDREELAKWRGIYGNKDREATAREMFRIIKSKIDAQREEEKKRAAIHARVFYGKS